MTFEPLRSLLFVPGNVERRVRGAGRFGADGIVIDLEDAVPLSEKSRSRAEVADLLPDLAPGRVWVRVNGADTGLLEADLDAVVHPGLFGVMLAKATADAVRLVDDVVSEVEPGRGVALGALRVLPLIEDAAGVASAGEIAAGPRVLTLALGTGDLTRDLGFPAIRWSPEGTELAYARAKLVIDARAAGRDPPLDGPYLAVRDADGFRADCLRARAFGYQGKLCLHPSQVAIANEVFAPDPEEVAFCRRVIEEFERAESAGSVSMTVEGVFVDYAIADKAREIVATAEKLAEREHLRATPS